MIHYTLLPRSGTYEVVTHTNLSFIYHLVKKKKLNLCYVIIQHMIDSCMNPKQSSDALAYGIPITLFLKDHNVPLENEQCDYDFMRFTSKTMA